MRRSAKGFCQGAPRGDEVLAHPLAGDTASEAGAIDRVSIAEEIPGRQGPARHYSLNTEARYHPRSNVARIDSHAGSKLQGG
jgi:hypothetical protein